MSFTRGPWAIGRRIHTDGMIDRIPVGIPESNFGVVCYTVASVHCYGDNAESNAHLIAASPEMFQALLMVRDADEDCIKDGVPGMPELARKRLDAAIAKAEGRS